MVQGIKFAIVFSLIHSQVLRSCLISLALAGVAVPLDASPTLDWFARVWQTEDGLPEHTIVGLEQTLDGYLWVATHRSLSRFDGMHFQEFTPATPASPADHQIRALLLDHRGRLWFAKDGGKVGCIENGRLARVLSLVEVLPGAQPRSMAEDGEANIWISDSFGAVFRIQGETTQLYSVSDRPTAGAVCWLEADVQGRLWFSQTGNVGIFRNGRFEVLLRLGQESSRLAAARQGGVWLVSGPKLYQCGPDGRLTAAHEVALEPGGGEMTISALLEDSARGVWIGTSSGGLFRFDGQSLQRVATSHPNIVNLHEDAEGNVWVGTRGGGLNRLRPRVVQLVGLDTGLPFAAVQSACEDAAGTLWLVGQNGALACRRQDGWSLVSTNAGWSGGVVVCVAADAKGEILIGTRDQGVFHHHQGAFVPLTLNSRLPNIAVRSLHVATNGDLFIAINSGVARLRARDDRLHYFPLPTGASDVRAMAQDPNGDMWMGTTSDGLLLRLHGDNLIDETKNILGGPKHIRCLQVTADGSLWFGFAGQGLGRLKHGQFFQFRADHGLRDEYISHVLADDRERLWIACNRGIFQVAQSELQAVAEGRAARVRSVVFGRGDGIPNLQATFGISPAATRTRDGRLLMPMLTGLAIIQPGLLREDSPPPPVMIERLSVNGRVAATYDDTEPTIKTNKPPPASLRASSTPLRLGPGVNRMEFEFTAISLASPENVLFRYQLVGLDEDWVDAGTVRVARYPHIPPGDYRFRVTACNHEGNWNATGASVALRVQPQLWEATWFRVVAAASGAGLLGGGVLQAARRRYRRKLERLEQQRALERERTRIAQDLHDDLGAGLVEISFSSELAQDPVLSSDEVREHTREIGTRAREMVTALDEIVWAVNPKHDTVSSLATYFCQFAQHFLKATPVRCHLEVARDLPAAPLNSEQRHNLFLAFKEALSNVVQHSGATELRLAISANDETLTISVQDNGCGLAAEASRAAPGADGLENMRRRLEQLGGSCELNGRPAKGTTVCFKVPLPPSPVILNP